MFRSVDLTVWVVLEVSHYDACVVLDGNPLIEDHLAYIHSDESTEEISDVT